jgi:hypothetical protein
MPMQQETKMTVTCLPMQHAVLPVSQQQYQVVLVGQVLMLGKAGIHSLNISY